MINRDYACVVIVETDITNRHPLVIVTIPCHCSLDLTVPSSRALSQGGTPPRTPLLGMTFGEKEITAGFKRKAEVLTFG